MPKIIENLQEKITEEVKKQIKENGYSKVTIRSVAGALGIATGTVYNYFSSKEEMAASLMASQWISIYTAMKKTCEEQTHPETAIRVIYDGLMSYACDNTVLFMDPEAISSFGKMYFEKHSLLRRQIADLLEPSCQKAAVHYTDALTEFIAESILSFCRERRDIAEFIETLKPLFKQEG